MEILIVYGLVFVFFIALFLFVLFVLARKPYTVPQQEPVAGMCTSRRRSVDTEKVVSYAVLSCMFISFCLLTFVGSRSRTS